MTRRQAWVGRCHDARRQAILVVEEDLAPEEGEDGLALEVPAVPVAVAGFALDRAAVEAPADARVDHDEVGVGAGGELAFAGGQAEDAGGGGAEQLGEFGQRDPASGDALAVEEWQQRLGARRAVGDLGEALGGEALLVGRPGRMVARDDLDVAEGRTGFVGSC